MSAIWKFEIEVTDEFTLTMPKFAQAVYVAVQNGRPWLWAMVDPAAELEQRRFFVHGTGHHITSGAEYVGSFMLRDGAFVGHLWEPGSRLSRVISA